MPEKLKPSKPAKVRSFLSRLRRPTFRAFGQRSAATLIAFNLYLIVASIVLFQDGPRPMTLEDGQVIIVHASAAVVALLGIGLASAGLIVKQTFVALRDRLWRRQITRDLLDRVSRDTASMKLGSDGEIILDVEGELNRRRYRTSWRRPGWMSEHFWISHGRFTSALATAFHLAIWGFVLYLYAFVCLVVFHTPEVVVKLGVMIAAPQTSAVEVDLLVGTAYAFVIVMGVLALAIIMGKDEAARRR